MTKTNAPVCKHCDLPIRETHQGHIRNEWEHVGTGMSYCHGTSNWAWPATHMPNSKPPEPAPISWEEARDAVTEKWSDIVVYRNKITRQWFWYRQSEADKVSDQFDDEPSAWLSAHSRLGGAEQRKELCECGHDKDAHYHEEESPTLMHCGSCNVCPKWRPRLSASPAVPAPPVLSPSELFRTVLHLPCEDAVSVVHTTSAAAADYCVFWTSGPSALPYARVQMFRGDEQVAEYHGGGMPTPPAEGSAELIEIPASSPTADDMHNGITLAHSVKGYTIKTQGDCDFAARLAERERQLLDEIEKVKRSHRTIANLSAQLAKACYELEGGK